MTDLERPLPEYHEGFLKRALKLEEDAEVPANMRELYWDAERTARRIGVNLSSEMLVVLCLLANRATPADPVSFLDESPKRDARVLARHRGEWRWGRYIEKKGKAIVVAVDDGTGEEREFHPTSVRFPTREELALIGE